MSNKKRILLIACGGTIACTTDATGVAKQSLSGEQLVNNISQLADYAEIETVQFRQINSSSITLNDALELMKLINSTEHDGYVITHGTDSIEETAFTLDLIHSSSKPIVLTGAMRHASLPSADGNANILAAAITAADAKSADQGVMVVLNDTVHAARFVTKAHTSRPDAFISKPGGAIGWLSENRLVMITRLQRRQLFNPEDLRHPDLVNISNVPIITSYSGDDGKLLKLISDSKQFHGLIIDGLGGGHVSELMAEQIDIATNELIVVITSRTGEGSTLQETYGNIGSEIDLINKGVIMAGWLNATQARILLQLSLVAGLDKHAIEHKFLI